MTPFLPATALLASDTLLRAVFDDSPSALLVVQQSGNVHAANRVARTRLRAFTPHAPLWTLVPPDEADAVRAWWDAQPGTPLVVSGWSFEARPLGEEYVLLDARPPLDPLHNPAFRHLVDAMPAIVWFVDAKRENRFLNLQWRLFTGTTAEDGPWWNQLHPDDLAVTQTLWRHSTEHVQPFEMEYRLRRHDGVYVWHLVQALPQFHPDGSLWGWIGVCSSLEPLERNGASRRLLDDLARERSERQSLAETLDARVTARTAQLEALNRTLEARNLDLHDFAFSASHDLQEPLRKIRSYADLLRLDYGEGLPPEGLHYLDRIQNASLRMSRLVRDLLAYSRLSTSVHPHETVDLSAVLDDVTSDLGLLLRDTGGRVEVGPLPTVVTDPTHLRQLLQNLVSNALKYRREGVPPVVQVSGRTEPDDDAHARHLVLTVSDNGRGFTPQEAEHIFAPFHRLVGREVEGTGFGLAIVRKIAERHGGTVTAEGEPGEGATFTVRLPVQAAG